MRRWLLGAAILALWPAAACDGGDGDGDADADVEGCGETGQACNMSTDCPVGQVCSGHRCGCIYDRVYEIEVLSGAVYPRAPGGYCWDGVEPSCEDPDVYAVVHIGDVPFRSTVIENTINPIWGESFEAFVTRTTVYGVWLWDYDAGEEDDIILEFSDVWGWTLTEDNLRNAGLRVQTEGATRSWVDLIFTPR